jgi:hypothetical protein
MDEYGQQQYDFDGEEVPGNDGPVLLDTRTVSNPTILKKRFGRRKFLIGAGIAGGGLLVAGFAGYKVLGYLFPPTSLFKLTGPTTTPQDIIIYTKGALDANWQNWSWTDNDLQSMDQPYQNQPVIRASLKGWGALSLHDGAGTLDLTDFGYLQFYVNGGSGSDQKAFAFFTDAQNNYTAQTLIGPYTDGGRILSNTWKLVRIPLGAMQARGITMSGVVIQDASGGVQPDIFITDLRIVYAPDLTPPKITQAMALDLGTITLVFDKRMLEDTIEKISLYTISGQEAAYSTPQAPLSAHYHPVSQSISLVVPTTMRAHSTYTVTLGAVEDKYKVEVSKGAQAKVTAQPLTLTVDPAQGQRAISPLIYGVAEAPASWLADVRPRLNRWGGNQTTRYNWKLGNAFSAARDYNFSNENYNFTSPADMQPSGVADQFFAANKAAGAETILTVPTIGWVAKDDHSSSANVPNVGGPPVTPNGDAIKGYDPTDNRRLTCVPSQARKGSAFTDPPDLTNPSVAQDEWIYHLKSRFGAAANGGVRYYAMDNEPDLWFATHVDIRPAEISYNQTRDIFLDYATAIKSVDPTALITGPVLSGWTGFMFSSLDRGDDNFKTAADYHAHGNQHLLPWWLSEIRKHDEQTGQRTLDVLDIHYYPQTDGVYAGNSDPKTNTERLKAVRSLWDPKYTDNSWIGDKIQLIPRMKQWIQENYPGTKLGITEWNFGADQTINGALAIAEVLSIYGREGLDLACYWAYTNPNTFGYAAQKLFTNFDGQGGSFGFTSVHAESSNYDLVSCYAAVDSDTGQLMVIVLNKSQVADLTPDIQLNNTSVSQAEVYQINDEAPEIKRLADVQVKGGSISLTLPAQSVTLFRFVK